MPLNCKLHLTVHLLDDYRQEHLCVSCLIVLGNCVRMWFSQSIGHPDQVVQGSQPQQTTEEHILTSNNLSGFTWKTQTDLFWHFDLLIVLEKVAGYTLDIVHVCTAFNRSEMESALQLPVI